LPPKKRGVGRPRKYPVEEIIPTKNEITKSKTPTQPIRRYPARRKSAPVPIIRKQPRRASKAPIIDYSSSEDEEEEIIFSSSGEEEIEEDDEEEEEEPIIYSESDNDNNSTSSASNSSEMDTRSGSAESSENSDSGLNTSENSDSGLNTSENSDSSSSNSEFYSSSSSKESESSSSFSSSEDSDKHQNDLYYEVFGSVYSESETTESSLETESSSGEVSNGEVPAASAYIRIKKNIYVGCKSPKIVTSEPCQCFYLPDVPDMACGTNCLNRFALEECDPSVCPSGVHCQNQRFQNRQYCKLKLTQTKKKGYGLATAQFISRGTFIIEYVGEVVDQKEFKRRTKARKSNAQKHFYIITLGGGKYVDATVKGNVARYINHSCDPNCKPEIWFVFLFFVLVKFLFTF